MTTEQISDYLAAARTELRSAEDRLRMLRSQRENPGNERRFGQLDNDIEWQEGLVRELRENAHFDWDDEDEA